MLIFNADDFGLTQTDVNRILFSLERGVIKSTTIVPNYVSERDLNRLNQKHVSSGLHINLVQGKPLSSAESLIDSNGVFLSKKALVRKLLMGRVDQKEIEQEIKMQFEFLLDNKIVISHIDTHQNMHLFPQVLAEIVKVSEEFKIKKIRALEAEYFWFRKTYSKSKLLIKNTVIKCFNNELLSYMQKPDKSILNAPGLGFSVDSKQHVLKLWEKAISSKYQRDLIYEISCHLSLSQSEFEFYNSDEFRTLLDSYHVEIGNFYDV